MSHNTVSTLYCCIPSWTVDKRLHEHQHLLTSPSTITHGYSATLDNEKPAELGRTYKETSWMQRTSTIHLIRHHPHKKKRAVPRQHGNAADVSCHRPSMLRLQSPRRNNTPTIILLCGVQSMYPTFTYTAAVKEGRAHRGVRAEG